jgi:hypothetical protein
MALTKVTNSMLVQPVNHNLLINPSFTVKQRGDVIDHMGSGTSYGPDRWAVRGVGGTGGTMSQSTTAIDPTTGINKMVVKHRNATNYAFTLQFIEAVNLLGLYGKEMTFSFSYSDVGGSGVPLIEVRSYDSSNTKKVLFNAIPTSLGNNRWSCTFTLSTTDGTIPDLNETGMAVLIYPNEKNTAPSEWSVWETKLEAGSVATPFIARSYGEELALCQRYYWKLPVLAQKSLPSHIQYASGGEGIELIPIFPVPMRATPSVEVGMGAGGSWQGYRFDGAAGSLNGYPMATSLSGSNLSGGYGSSHLWWYAASGTPFTTGSSGRVCAIAQDGYFSYEAEL